jgi:3-hydroxymyristoyl/3-hydroxydecanoyl-(acyl carrier protein) dehydratase
MQELDLNARLVSLPGVGDSFPRVLSVLDESPCLRLSLDISPDLSWFRGHFPDMPVLPGVVQLHWAVIVARAVFELSDSPLEIKRLKFKKVVVPPQVIELAVSMQASNEIQFEFCTHDAQYSQGRLVFAESAAC